LRRALDEYTVGGIRTTLPFFREIVRDEEFIKGHLDTGFISRFFERRGAANEAFTSADQADETEMTRRDMAAIAAALDYIHGQKRLSASMQPREQEQSQWRLAGRTALHNSRI
jgi:acetyl/propionyl-CoA carboxylase alpha subunit